MLVVDEENGTILDRLGNELIVVSRGEIAYGAQDKVPTNDEMLVKMFEGLVFFNDYICPIVAFHPIGGPLCAFTAIVESLFC